jgi:uncharacterized protein YmfQ (DUF2313 family)
MGMTAVEYYQALQALLPPGKAFPRDQQGDMQATLMAFADELARVDARLDNLIDEADPRTTLEMSSEWEAILDLSEFASMLNTIQDLRLALTSKLTEVGGQSRSYFIGLAASLGYTITITEFRPYTCEIPIDQGIYDETVKFVWQVNSPETTIRESTCQAPCADSLRSWGNEVLERAISRRKPAHTAVIFSYGG